jgi:hypothetical protein
LSELSRACVTEAEDLLSFCRIADKNGQAVPNTPSPFAGVLADQARREAARSVVRDLVCPFSLNAFTDPVHCRAADPSGRSIVTGFDDVGFCGVLISNGCLNKVPALMIAAAV